MEYGVVRQNKQSRITKMAAAACVALMIVAGMAANTFALTYVVYPSDTMGWVNGSSNGGTINYGENAPESFGNASLRFKTDGTSLATAVYGHDVDQALSTVTTLSYYTNQQAASFAGGSASMFVTVDLNNDGIIDTNLIHEPYLQNAANPDVAPVIAGEWQQWEAGDGLFWSSVAYEGTLNLVAGVDNSPLYTLNEIRAAYPDARLTVFGVSVGSNAPNYTILVDGITINETVYDFEGSSEVYTIPTDKDQCKQLGWMTLSSLGGTLFTNQGQCVAYVQSSTNSAHHQ